MRKIHKKDSLNFWIFNDIFIHVICITSLLLSLRKKGTSMHNLKYIINTSKYLIAFLGDSLY